MIAEVFEGPVCGSPGLTDVAQEEVDVDSAFSVKSSGE